MSNIKKSDKETRTIEINGKKYIQGTLKLAQVRALIIFFKDKKFIQLFSEEITVENILEVVGNELTVFLAIILLPEDYDKNHSFEKAAEDMDWLDIEETAEIIDFFFRRSGLETIWKKLQIHLEGAILKIAEITDMIKTNPKV